MNIPFIYPSETTSAHAVQLINVPNWIMLPRQTDDSHYMTFSDRPSLTRNLLSSDNAMRMLLNLSDTACLPALLHNNLEQIRDTCTTHVLFNTEIPKAISLDTDLLCLNNVTEYFTRLSTQNNWTRHEGCTSCRIQLKACTQFKAGPFSYTSAKSNCSSDHSAENTHSINYIAPLHILINAMDLNEFENLTADYIFNEPVNTSLPELQLYNAKFSQQYSILIRSSMDVTEALNRTRDGIDLYKDLAHQLAHDKEISYAARLINTAALLNFQSILVYTLPFITIGLVVAVYLLYKKIEQLAQTLLLMNNPNPRFAMNS